MPGTFIQTQGGYYSIEEWRGTPRVRELPQRPDPATFLFDGLPDSLVEWLRSGDAAAPPEIEVAGRPSPASLARRLRFQFPFSEAEARAKASQAIRDLSDEEWAHCLERRGLDWIDLFGERRFARSFLGNMLRRAGAFRERAADSPVSHVGEVDPWNREHVRKIDQRSRAGEPVSRYRHRVTHRLEVTADAVPVGETIRCWLPFPSEVAPQRAIRLLASSSPATLSPGDAPHRTAYLEQPQTSEGAAFEIEYEFETEPTPPIREQAWGAAMDEISPPGLDEAPWLAEDAERDPWTPELRARAAKVVEGIPEGAMLARGEAIYRWVNDQMRYAAEFEYGVLPRLAAKGHSTGEGDCGVLASLFIVLCRIAGVPARWRSGWFLKPKNGNMHDWAEFWGGPTVGWRPCDPTYDQFVHFVDRRLPAPPPVDPTSGRIGNVRHRGRFYRNAMDGFRMISNLAIHTELVPAKQFERSEPLDFQRGEVEWKGGNLFFDAWHHKVSWSSEELP